MTKKIEEQAREAYFANDRSRICGLGLFIDGYCEGYRKALFDVRLILDRCNNNLERLNAIRELVNEMCNEVKDEVSLPEELNVVTVDDPGGEVYPAENAESALVSFFFNPDVKP